jgi:hypothetical protein
MTTATTAEVHRGSKERRRVAVHRADVRKRSTSYRDLELLTGG